MGRANSSSAVTGNSKAMQYRSIMRSCTTSPSLLLHTATRTSAPTGRCLRLIYRTARACKLWIRQSCDPDTHR